MNYKSLFEEKLKQLGISISPTGFEQMNSYYEMLMTERELFNLTGGLSQEKVIDYLFMDSLRFLNNYNPSHQARIIDLGTGAGFPGMVIKIARPDLHLSALDSSKKKISFIAKVCETLSLSGVELLNRRAEEISRDPSHRETYDFVLTRGVAELSVITEIGAALLKKGGIFTAWKGSGYQKEIDEMRSSWSLLGLDVPHSIPVSSVEKDWFTVLISFKKLEKTPEKFPRSYQGIKRKHLGLIGKV